ncbi:hypothetical protein FPZ43_04635 [Mucilaginibacter pallidiroseus]|uniref:DUF4440 domain-containing protein n=1 Tax=Mucilaginibacter pallidiroseus TaxID=2599295 RepID=A0A563UFU9_9SPHI|nr:nuclear transport factor 2 family protein [Mucilaginibacter pallidiroseus]TWR30234.1 hypothetical protein FPZ43_04635 [Mucilaginibacter pallidiroseus]
MKKLFIICTLICVSSLLRAQQSEANAVKQTINTMFAAMKAGDSTALKNTFAKGMVLQSVVNRKDGTTALITEQPEVFIKQVGAPHKEIYDERITFGDIKIDGTLASVWTPYKFYLGDKFSHCGVNFFQLMKGADGWKIIYIVDTHRKDNCPE